jgi:hypothetical protein
VTVLLTGEKTYRIVDWRVGLLDEAVTEAEFRAGVEGLPVDAGSVDVDEHGITMLMPLGAPRDPGTVVLVAEVISITGELTALLEERGRDFDTHIAFCGHCHLRVARAWRRTCVRCEQQIPVGNLGPVTWMDAAGCAKGTWSFQHGCGAWNTPTEVTVNPQAYRTAREALDDALRQLDAAIADEVATEVAEIRARLAADVARGRSQIAAGLEYRDVATGGELQPGVYSPAEEWDDATGERVMPAGGLLVAWAWHPAGGDYLEAGAPR